MAGIGPNCSAGSQLLGSARDAQRRTAGPRHTAATVAGAEGGGSGDMKLF